jgi:hypothetical protein
MNRGHLKGPRVYKLHPPTTASKSPLDFFFVTVSDDDDISQTTAKMISSTASTTKKTMTVLSTLLVASNLVGVAAQNASSAGLVIQALQAENLTTLATMAMQVAKYVSPMASHLIY